MLVNRIATGAAHERSAPATEALVSTARREPVVVMPLLETRREEARNVRLHDPTSVQVRPSVLVPEREPASARR